MTLTPSDMTILDSGNVIHLQSAGTSVVLDLEGDRLPRITYWGADLGGLDDGDLAAVRTPAHGPRGFFEDGIELSVLPEAGRGWQGRPGLIGHRAGRAWSPRCVVTGVEHHIAETGSEVVVRARDESDGVGLTLWIELTAAGLVRLRAELTNLGHDEFDVHALTPVLPVPASATQIVDFAGRWAKERTVQRTTLGTGTHLRESRRGRTGADSPLVLIAADPGVTFESGSAWGVHVAWSGNHVSYAEAMASGERVIGGGELLMPGEIRLAHGESYSSPWVYGGYAEGLDALAARFHGYVRARASHPRSPRPVTMNVWEAVYFDHDLSALTDLADLAQQIGCERYVLDDGWFRGRRRDNAGLGDWYIDEDVWPGRSLHSLADYLRSLGLGFGMWFEPEMVNPDSDLFREHPEWVLQPSGTNRWPTSQRSQQVLNLAIPEAWEFVRSRVVALVDELGIEFIKWDHNRDLIDAGDAATGRPGVHEQTLAVYRLMDAIKAACPGLEIESCSSGGARVDLAVLEHTDRVWASDCIDALERLQIQRWTAQLLPPELVGAHVGADRSHTTGRRHDLGFRAAVAMFGHLGVEWDLREASATDLAELAEWIALYKRERALIHRGVTVRRELPWIGGWLHGAVAEDGDHALYGVFVTDRTSASPVPRVRLPGLDPERDYIVEPVGPMPNLDPMTLLPALWSSSLRVSGTVLMNAGIRLPLMNPETALLIRVSAA